MQYYLDDAINPSFYCPITGALMEDPVIDSEGNTYERTAIEAWLDRHNTSPITRNRLTKDDLRPNRALKNSIDEVMASQGRLPSRNPLLAPAVSGSAPIEFPTLQLTLNSKLMDATQIQPLYDKKITDDSYCEFLLHASVLAPPIKERVPSDIVLVVDVSGSMGNEATTKGVESSGLCLLDIVKHAVKTIISVLDDRDRLSLVSFSNAANKIFDLMTMDAVGKENALNLLEKLEPGGMTNLWDGVQMGMNILKSRVLPGGSKFGNNASVLLLTDGEPNIEPPRGFLPMMKRYAAQNGGRYPGIIGMFGFGYNLDSDLLRKMATEGGGMYAFIPDSGFVGTAFVNALANILSTVTLDAELTLEYDEDNDNIM
jgi:Mg-chelatase subunit ChlD